MLLYRSLSRLFPTSFTAKVFFLAFLGTHIPLIAFLAFILATGEVDHRLDTLMLLTLATLIGTGATLFALRLVLRPIYAMTTCLSAWEEGRQPAPLPSDFRDEIGELMRHANTLMDRASHAVARIRTEAESDLLTGTLNRRGAERWLQGCEPGWVIQFDIDHFKQVNDAFGHDAGDKVLQDCAIAASLVLRPDDMFARFGGEEFVIVLPGLSEEMARQVAERLRVSVERHVRRPDGTPLTVSVGLSPHAGGTDISKSLEASDAALYEAKRAGRNQVRYAGDRPTAA